MIGGKKRIGFGADRSEINSARHSPAMRFWTCKSSERQFSQGPTGIHRHRKGGDTTGGTERHTGTKLLLVLVLVFLL